MKDVTLRNGKVMKDREFIEERGFGDTPTDFVATKADLVLLADKLGDELLNMENLLQFNVCRKWRQEEDYISFRLGRVLDFLPELAQEAVGEKLRLGREENKASAEAYENSCENEIICRLEIISRDGQSKEVKFIAQGEVKKYSKLLEEGKVYPVTLRLGEAATQ